MRLWEMLEARRYQWIWRIRSVPAELDWKLRLLRYRIKSRSWKRGDLDPIPALAVLTAVVAGVLVAHL
jgi:hypothetical protein